MSIIFCYVDPLYLLNPSKLIVNVQSRILIFGYGLLVAHFWPIIINNPVRRITISLYHTHLVVWRACLRTPNRSIQTDTIGERTIQIRRAIWRVGQPLSTFWNRIKWDESFTKILEDVRVFFCYYVKTLFYNFFFEYLIIFYKIEKN